MKIGFIGLGNMGAAIAANLRKAGHEVSVWNRTPSKAAPLVQSGASLARTPRDAAAGSEIVFTMLANDAALHAVADGVDGIVAGLAHEAVHVSLSTIAVSTADWLAQKHSAAAQRFVSAPVFGRPEAAAAAKLFVVAAGAEADYQRALPLFGAIGQRTFYVGTRPSAANLLKLCGNFLILSAIEALGEAMSLAQKGGVPPAQLLEIVTGTLFDSPVYRTYGAILAEKRYTPAGFAAPLGLKDMGLVDESAEALRVPMPLLRVLKGHLLQTIAQDGEDIDWSAIAQVTARNAGL
jgi:3-hydroxyisobutyrate dehydrogenase-like beta-hydroxyacid dehydrogenase